MEPEREPSSSTQEVPALGCPALNNLVEWSAPEAAAALPRVVSMAAEDKARRAMLDGRLRVGVAVARALA